MFRVFFTMALAAATVSACAKAPSSIPPVSVASAEYSGRSCQSLQVEKQAVDTKLQQATDRQNGARVADAVGVFLVLIPVSKLTGDAESDIAQYKGEQLALERSIQRQGCY